MQRVLGALAESDQSHVGPLPCSDGRNVRDVDLAGDDLVTEPGHDLGENSKPVGPLIRDQNSQVMDPVQPCCLP